MAISRGNSLLMKKQWAEDGSTVIPNPPVAGTTYRDESIDEANIAEGQQYDGVADSARWNQLLYIMTGILKDTLAHGVLPWLNTQDYAEGAVVIGSNGDLYRAKVVNGPSTSNTKDPASDSTEQTWVKYGTLKTSNVSNPLTYTTSGGLKLNIDNGLQVSNSKLAVKLANNSGVGVDSNGIKILLNSSWSKFDANGNISGAYVGYVGNIDDVINIDDSAALYFVTPSATGTKPEGANSGFVIAAAGTQTWITVNTYAFRIYDQGTRTWMAWNNLVKPYQFLPPVEFIYVQFAGTADPTTLFGGTWTNVSGYFAGLFFRAEGGEAAAFGGSQQGGAPNITGGFRVTLEEGAATSGCFYTQSQEGNGVSGTNGTNVIYGINAALSSGWYGLSPNEIRPSNSTIRIWKRTA